MIDNSGVVPGEDDIKAVQEFNQLTVHQILNFNICGNAKLHVISAEFQGKPTLVWKTMKSMYHMVSAVRAEQYQEELRQFMARDGETITDVDAQLWMLVSKLQSQGITTNGAARRSALLSALISEDWDDEVARR